MIRRLLALILVLALALPAVVMPSRGEAVTVEAAMPATVHHGADHGQAGDRGMPSNDHGSGHVCIGCIAPIGELPFAFRTPAMIGPDLSRWVAHALSSRRGGPETPPPRTA